MIGWTLKMISENIQRGFVQLDTVYYISAFNIFAPLFLSKVFAKLSDRVYNLDKLVYEFDIKGKHGGILTLADSASHDEQITSANQVA